MKRICKPLVAVILVFSLIGSLFSVQISAAKNILNEIPTVYEIEKWYNQQPIPKTNSEYVKYLQDVENGDISPYGDIIPTSRPIVSDDTISNLQTARAATLPPQYYPSDYNNVTSVKDQGEEGLCWAYAAVSTIESFLIKNHNIERDYSENYYNYYFATDQCIKTTMSCRCF